MYQMLNILGNIVIAGVIISMFFSYVSHKRSSKSCMIISTVIIYTCIAIGILGVLPLMGIKVINTETKTETIEATVVGLNQKTSINGSENEVVFVTNDDEQDMNVITVANNELLMLKKGDTIYVEATTKYWDTWSETTYEYKGK